MDNLDILPIRFALGGQFVHYGDNVNYVGGDEAMSYIERDKVSLPEIVGHLKDHMVITDKDKVFLHWLFPGKELSNGLRMLDDDKVCNYMSQCITQGGVADVYAEVIHESSTEDDDESEYADDSDQGDSEEDVATEHIPLDAMNPSRKMEYRDLEASKSFYKSPMKSTISQKSRSNKKACSKQKATESDQEVDESDDSDWLSRDVDNSDDNEEANENRENAKMFKKGIRLKDDISSDIVPVGSQVLKAVSVEDVDGGNDTPYFDSSEEASYDDEGPEINAIRRKSKFPRFDNKAAIPVFSVGMTFRGREQFKEAVVKYGLAMKRHISFPKDEKDRIRGKCSWKGCPWVIYGALRTNCDWFQVKTYISEHRCPQRRDNKLVTARRIADKYESLIKANPSWKLQHLKETVLLDMFANVTLSKIKRAKYTVMKRVYEAAREEYPKVFDYQLEILRSNPDSTVAICLDPDIMEPIFQRIYVCFDACKRGFLAGCRKVIGLDGCFFKGACNGELLCALGRDANNQMYPVAWAVVEKETSESWYWFIGLLQKDLNVARHGEGWVVISDQQKGLLNAIGELLPQAEHRMCARHIYANWRKKFRDQKFQLKFWKCAKASNREIFNYRKTLLAQLTPDGVKAMMATNPIHWSRAWFRIGNNCDSVDNNMCESFNNWIIGVRALPIISMLEGIRTKTYIRIQENKFKSEKWHGRICPNILKKLNKYIEESGKCVTIWNGKDGFEVRHEDKRYKIDMEQRTCSCRYWQLSGIPCCHAISAIHVMSTNPEDYIADCYNIDHYNKTYEHCMLPMEGMSSWPISDHPRPSPPGYVKMPGRPRKERRRDPFEAKKGTKLSKVGTKMRCSICRSDKHNLRKCPNNPEKVKKNIMKKKMLAQASAAAVESSKQRIPKRKRKASSKWVPATEEHFRTTTIFQTGAQSHAEAFN